MIGFILLVLLALLFVLVAAGLFRRLHTGQSTPPKGDIAYVDVAYVDRNGQLRGTAGRPTHDVLRDYAAHFPSTDVDPFLRFDTTDLDTQEQEVV